MKLWAAILFTLGLAAMCMLIWLLLRINVAPWVVFISSFWVALDSSGIELTRYKSLISTGPFVLYLTCFFLWIIVFPWYLFMRYQIRAGTAVFRDAELAG